LLYTNNAKEKGKNELRGEMKSITKSDNKISRNNTTHKIHSTEVFEKYTLAENCKTNFAVADFSMY
jgi:hypothetical protein